METSEIRRLNLKRLAATYPSQTAFANAIYRELDQVGHLLSGRRNIGARLAKHIETALNLNNGSLSLPPPIAHDQNGQYNQSSEIDHNQQILAMLQTNPLPRDDAAAVYYLITRLSA
ncbi:hypothetical protein HQN60_12535 [Deefgea piscis]|uniref:Uncharacterized protein n=1 Tax=Deefgea piscis TaxID=2739061 RepID=A0A6M8SQI2_9NEIS|nr:hypothetical protein [Deefgea piscis]QKJ67465.1 hypothetical protein HQN60_12535 [Deefgea piscis]